MPSSTDQPLPQVPHPPHADGPPRSSTSFVGRDREIADIAVMLERDDVRLLTLTGPGGVGKTRLAIQVLAQLEGGRSDTVAFVPLAAVRDPDLVPPATAQALGVPNTPDQPLLVRMHAFLEHRRTLLVLDNLEHLLATGPFVADLIAHCASLTVLCTSRSRLNLSGEHVFPVQPLTVEASVALFAQRTQALSPGFDLTEDLIPTINAICHHLDRLPLAIELAAARTTVLPPRALLARLQHPLGLLTGGPQDLPDRQRTMRNVIAWSYNLLPEGEKLLFRRLGVFIDGFTLEAAEAVAGNESDVLAGLESLVTSSLLNTTPNMGDTPRFAMLETIREFALEQLFENGEEPATRRLHARHFVDATEAELPNQETPELRAAHDRIEADLQNCRAALAWTLETGEAELGIRLAGAIWRTWWYAQAHGNRPWHERMSEGRDWLEKTLRMRDDLPVSVLTEAMAGAAQLANFHADFSTAQSWAEELLTRSRAESHVYGTFWAALILGYSAWIRHDDDTAKSMYALASETAPAVPHPESRVSQALVSLSRAEERSEDTSSALAHYEQGLDLGRISGNPFAISMATGNFGRFMRKQGDLYRASTLLSEAMSSYLQQRDYGGVACSLAELALVALEAGHAERALVFLAAAHPLPFHPDDQPTYEQAIAAVRTRLDETAYDNAWNAGLQMSWEMVIAEITGLTHDLETPLSHDGSGSTVEQYGLTRRELDVVRLLTEGRSNRAIADQLSLSQRTVEHHVLHILTKLGLESRTAVVAFAVRHGLG